MTSLRVERPTTPARDRPQMFELKPLEWDTAFFGARMGSIALTHAAAHSEALADLTSVLDDARAQGYVHLIFRVSVDDSENIWAAEATGFRLVDVGIDSTFRFDKNAIPDAHSDIGFRAARDEDVPALSELAAEAFTLSRFSADPFFTPEQVKDFHRTWTRNLCDGLARQVLVAEIDGAIAGFVSCAVSGVEGRIPLIGVDARFRGQHVGQALISQALRWFRDAGCSVVHVKTQAHNYRALALYHRAGFVVTKSELTFSVALRSATTRSREVLS